MAPAATIRRKIQFFTTSLTTQTKNGLEVLADQAALWKRLAALPFEKEDSGKQGRNRGVTQDVFEAVDVQHLASPSLYYGRFYRTKYSDFPLVGTGEKDQPLSLESDQGLRHPSHFVWWDYTKKKEVDGVPAPKVGILGMEFNQSGPRAKGLERYVHDVFEGQLILTILPVIDDKAWEDIIQQRYVRKVKARVLMPDGGLGAEKDNLAGLDVPDLLGGVRTFEWSAKPAKGHRFDLHGVTKRLTRFMKSEVDVRLSVELEDGQLVDVMESQVVGVEQVQKANDGSRSVNPGQMYAAIRNAHDKLGARVARGLGLHPGEK